MDYKDKLIELKEFSNKLKAKEQPIKQLKSAIIQINANEILPTRSSPVFNPAEDLPKEFIEKVKDLLVAQIEKNFTAGDYKEILGLLKYEDLTNSKKEAYKKAITKAMQDKKEVLEAELQEQFNRIIEGE